ncbi:Asp-tRNA(Asn)/Glu-tRNA(Gln) amidotransferase A subunit family amidase [Pseudoduganella lurida]|uniref:Asp-tRNA(Asn)/Glu-tRNA(Gln) amidotransferase A subunit family amidase n=1 Tax=Pseudoduganella lurida TaxID=1036180 RepID=A0A562RMZ4_9BURK|nr:amidase [Pseudoduganella lurida]TWI70233.1 Asp-tRNA(Asn)/Glu-tRNA(Gln) amidotransferase A subunit family amidase [Pseudoduganella lurida]
MPDRRRFLINAPLGLLATASAVSSPVQAQPPAPATPATAGAPPTFGTLPPTGPQITAATFAEAEKLMQVTLTPAQRQMAASAWPTSLAGLMKRRTAPGKLKIGDSVVPMSRFEPVLPGTKAGPARARFVRSFADPGRLPASDADIAFASVAQLSRWIESRQLTSERLTGIYLERCRRFDPRLKAIITLLPERALEQARAADREIAAGKYRGPLHGIPYGVKDLLDTAGIATTWGAEPLKNRVPVTDAAVVARLNDAGAILLAKLSLGALAMNDIWFGGQTMNPWLPEEGASGSSAGPGAAMAAALVAFTIGSETGGSIVSPAMRCGVTGLRPTFGRVPRTGAMTLCWSLDKLGPMTRSVEDAMLVLDAIAGPDAGDLASVPAKLDFDAAAPVRGLRIGYLPEWQREASDVDRAALELARKAGMKPVPVALPDWPYHALNTILFAEAAAAFEDWTRDGRMDMLSEQTPDAWPNLLREARFLSAVDFVQADRLRRLVAERMAAIFGQVDVLLVPSLREEMLIVSNNTGHPSLTLRTGFVQVDEARSDWAPHPSRPLPKFAPPRRVPHGVTLIGRLFDEGTLARAGIAIERLAGVANERPPGF